MKRLLLLVLLSAVAAQPQPVLAAPILQIDSGGQLTGALGVVVDGAEYDVTFVDGTCESVFAPCANSSFEFYRFPASGDPGGLASQALLDQVFIDLSPGPLFDSQPWLTRGVGSFNIGFVYTPELLHPDGDIYISILRNTADIPGDAADMRYHTFVTTASDTTDSNAVWAVWVPHEASVPEPASYALILGGLGLVGAFASRRRGRS